MWPLVLPVVSPLRRTLFLAQTAQGTENLPRCHIIGCQGGELAHPTHGPKAGDWQRGRPGREHAGRLGHPGCDPCSAQAGRTKHCSSVTPSSSGEAALKPPSNVGPPHSLFFPLPSAPKDSEFEEPAQTRTRPQEQGCETPGPSVSGSHSSRVGGGPCSVLGSCDCSFVLGAHCPARAG